MPRQRDRLEPDDQRLTSEDQRRMVALLRHAAYNEVAKALGVSRSAVGKWAVGQQVTPWNLQRVEGLLSYPNGASAAPPWAEQLERKLDVLVAKAGVDPVDAQDEAEARRLVEQALKLVPRGPGAAGR